METDAKAPSGSVSDFFASVPNGQSRALLESGLLGTRREPLSPGSSAADPPEHVENA
jgi:hypothetical protein